VFRCEFTKPWRTRSKLLNHWAPTCDVETKPLTLKKIHTGKIWREVTKIRQINSKGFWQKCTALERIMLLVFVHHLMFLNKTRFRNWIFLSSSKIMVAPTLSGPRDTKRSYVRFQVLMAASIKFSLLGWHHVEVDQRFRGAYCVHSLPWWLWQNASLKRWSTSTRLYGATSQKTLHFGNRTCFQNVVFF
jgi:hypothetical protein